MKIILLAGGLGSRLSEYTSVIPKPMVKIGDQPILWHIMNIFAKYNYNDFVVATGYKGEVINFQHESLNLQIPHEKINQRNFVLFPLKEIYPEWKHPKTNEIISTLIEKLPEVDRKSILKIEKY